LSTSASVIASTTVDTTTTNTNAADTVIERRNTWSWNSER
jgi:hypothetical protein